VTNPTPNAATRTDGAASGIVMLEKGDQLHFNCHIDYTNARAATNPNAPSPEANGTLKFADETFKAEMCLLYGNTTGQLLFPSPDSSPLPAFATQ
jgi:hypothetical protein